MAPVCDLRKDHRIDHLGEGGFKVRTDIVDSTGTLLSVNAERSGSAKLDCFLPSRQGAKEAFHAVTINNEERRCRFKIEIDTDTPFSDIRTIEDDGLFCRKYRPPGERIKFHNHFCYTFSIRSCGATARTFS